MTFSSPPQAAKKQLTLLVLAVVLGMSPWFSATVVAPAMVAASGGAPSRAVWLTIAVQGGFVLGSLISASFLLPDRLKTERLAAWSALAAAAATALMVVEGLSFGLLAVLRVVAGAALAGVYPPGMKLAVGWTQRRRGLVVGLLVAGTTLGSAAPHLFRAFVPVEAWRSVVLLAAGSAFAAALLFFTVVRRGPYHAPSSPFDPRVVRSLFRNRGVLLATGGYLGHMWELYAMWSSIGLFFGAVGAARGWSPATPAWAAFATVAAGAIGCAIAGFAGDRVGRAKTTIVAMVLSGMCSLLIGGVVEAPAVVLLAVAVLWGTSIVADSAQFSAAVAESAPPEYVGTALTLQTASGFLLTMVTIGLMPVLVARWGWEWAYAPLAIGPSLGVVAMGRYGAARRARTSH